MLSLHLLCTDVWPLQMREVFHFLTTDATFDLCFLLWAHGLMAVKAEKENFKENFLGNNKKHVKTSIET